MGKKTVIIGGVAGGASAAARLRRRDETMEIILLERGEYISYANCGLPYYIGDVINERENLLLQTPEAMKAKFNIDVRIRNEVIKIVPDEKVVSIYDYNNKIEYMETYDNLVIATGSRPMKPNIPGIEGKNIFTLWTVPDTDQLKTAITENHFLRAAVVGGGFIGLEMAENLHNTGLSVSVIEMQNQVMPPLDYEMAQLLHENMEANQVELILGDGVTKFKQSDNGIQIHLSSNRIIEADLVILAMGVTPNSHLAKDAGLSINQKGGIQVDEYLRTSDPFIYAVGDVIEVEHGVLKEKSMIPLAGPANKQGRICADNIVGDLKRYKGSYGTSVAKVFDLTTASVGANEKMLQQRGMQFKKDYYVAIINQKSHAGYYPGATMITIKLLFDGGGKLLGAQAVGQDGVDKRMDVLATTLRLGGTIYDLSELDLAYAPPYGSAKDPINMLGFVAENILKGLVEFVTPFQLDDMMANQEDQPVTVLDVTESVERMVFSIPGSYHIPLGQLHNRFHELNPDHCIVVYCAIGVRSYDAARILMQNGYSAVFVLAGGTSFYKSTHYRQGKTSERKDSEIRRKKAVEDNQTLVAAEVKLVNCTGMQCPGPIMKVNKEIKAINENDVIKVVATDMGFIRDVESWCNKTGNTLVKSERTGNDNIVYIKKGMGNERVETKEILKQAKKADGKTIIVFSNDLDKVLASFIIANGASAMGREVTMFFTFWGLNVLRRPHGEKVKKGLIDTMFGKMMPKGTKKLKLSKMNMGGMGSKMMKKVMKDKNVSSLEELLQQAMDSGIKLIACTMSMDIMGIRKEELIDGVEYAGVATYLGSAEDSNVNLFI